MKNLNSIKRFERLNSSKYMSIIRNIFFRYFSLAGFEKKDSVSFVESKKYDPSTRFIGSHTNVFKKDLLNNNIPEYGYLISQQCFNSKNLPLYLDPSKEIVNGSLFECHGLIIPFCNNLIELLNNLSNFFSEGLGIGHLIDYHINPIDNDLIIATSNTANSTNLKIGELPLNKTRHNFGHQSIKGRDIVLTLGSNNTNIKVSFAVVVLIEIDGIPEFIEVSISPGKILQQLFDLNHYLDCFPIQLLPISNEIMRRKLEDIIIAITALYREGIKPGGGTNQRQILRNFIRCFLSLVGNLDVELDSFFSYFEMFEKHYFGKSEMTKDIILHLSNK